MSKSLSEQVAELEAERDQLKAQQSYLWDIKESLRVENKELRNDHHEGECSKLRIELHDIYQRAYQAERERDDARAQGISDLNRIHRHQATIRRLEEENTALRAGQGRWPNGDDSPAGEQVPRVISAEELRVGQRVAVELNSGWFAGDVTGINRVISNGCESTGPAKGLTDRTIVLLEDAPGPERDAAPRLTVHALNTAPVGSWLNRAGISLPRLIKQPDGLWAVSITHVGLSSEFALSEWPDATLTHPERGDDE